MNKAKLNTNDTDDDACLLSLSLVSCSRGETEEDEKRVREEDKIITITPTNWRFSSIISEQINDFITIEEAVQIQVTTCCLRNSISKLCARTE